MSISVQDINFFSGLRCPDGVKELENDTQLNCLVQPSLEIEVLDFHQLCQLVGRCNVRLACGVFIPGSWGFSLL